MPYGDAPARTWRSGAGGDILGAGAGSGAGGDVDIFFNVFVARARWKARSRAHGRDDEGADIFWGSTDSSTVSSS